jgi:hypothetical protein
MTRHSAILIASVCSIMTGATPETRSCANVGDTVTVKGVFMRTHHTYFVPHAFPYRPFCVLFSAAGGTLRQSYGPPLTYKEYHATSEGFMVPVGLSPEQLRSLENKYLEVTGVIGTSDPIDDPSAPFASTFPMRMPSLRISKAVDIDADVRGEQRKWFAECNKWQDDNFPEFSKQVFGGTVNREPPPWKSQEIWALTKPLRCTLWAVPASKVLIPEPQPVFLVRPE